MPENLNQKSIEKFLNELDVLIRARYPLISINTYEEDRVRQALVDLMFKEKHKEKPLYFWSRPNGLQKIVDPIEGELQHPPSSSRRLIFSKAVRFVFRAKNLVKSPEICRMSRCI